MTPERHHRIGDLYHRALEMPAGRREAFLAEACGGDEALAREVWSLLEAHDRAGTFIEAPAIEIAAAALAATSPSEPFRSIGHYEVRSLLGRGGMGEVYRAHDRRLGRDVALKILPDRLALDAEHLARFEREARLLAALNHPNIAALYGLEEADGRRALVLELVEGVTLADRLATGPLPLSATLTVAHQIADALDAAHERGIVHRDLKPSNIVVRSDGTVKVLDFGLAKALAPAGNDDISRSNLTSQTQAHMVLGTTAYMSPEQARGLAVDARTDIWALGCVLYEMLTGRRAFAGDTASDVIASILERVPDWTALPRETPPLVRRLLRRCLEKDPKRRLRSIGDARGDLEDGATSPDAGVTWRPGQFTPVLVRALAGIGSIAAVTTVAFVLSGDGVTPPVEGTQQFVLLPPPDTAFGSGPLDRTPSFAVSPDGRRVVFAARGASGGQMWVRPIDGLTAEPVPGTDNAHSMFWSPDGQSVGFFADRKLKKVALAGGKPLTLADAPSGSGGAWNRSGEIVFAPSTQGPLLRVPANGGTPSPVTRLGANDLGHVRPQFLPDGRHVMYLVRAAEPHRGIYIASLDSGETKRILDARERALYAHPGHLLFLRDGRLFAQPIDVERLELSGDAVPIADSVAFISTEGRASYDVSETGTLVYRENGVLATMQPVWIDRSGRTVGPVGQPRDYQTLRLSPDRSRLSIELHDPRTATGDLWILDLATGGASRFTFDGMHNNAAVWSPDGRQIVFNGRPNGVRNLHLKPADGSAPDEPLLAPGRDRVPNHWSPDGRRILYIEDDPATRWDIWTLEVPERRQTPFLRSSFSEIDPVFSPDGRWVAYVSNETSRFEVYVAAFPSGTGKRKVSIDGGRAPRWSDDGTELFFIQSLESVMTAAVTWRDEPFIGVPRLLFTTEMNATAPFMGVNDWFDVAGDRFLIVPPPRGPAPPAPPLTVVVNWPALLTIR